MHEMGIAQQIADIALGSIPEDMGHVKIESLNLKVGRLAAVVEDSLKFCFEIIVKGTPLEGAELVIEHVPVKVHCISCNNIREVDGAVFSCPTCDDGKIEIISGRELEVVSIELADS